MNDDYENVEWHVHTALDAYTPEEETNDPLTSFTNSFFGQESFLFNRDSSPSQIPPTAASLVPSSDSTASLATPPLETQPHTMSSLHSPVNHGNDHPTRPDHTLAKPFAAKALLVQVSDPQKHDDGTQSAFISYRIMINTTIETFSCQNPVPVRRRFQDFCWLHDTLIQHYPACIVPPLPEKHRLEYLKGDRFSAEFVERRRISLEWFLNRIAAHPKLQHAQCLRVFLESANFKDDKLTYAKHVPPSSLVFGSLSGSLFNAFARVQKPDERFVNMKGRVDRLQENLNTVERLYARVAKRQHDLEQDYSSLASTMRGLSAREPQMRKPLYEFAKTTSAYVDEMKRMTRVEDLLFLNQVHELLAYCHSAKSTLRARDQKQIHFEELSALLHRTTQEQDRLKHSGRNFDLNITEIVTDKINTVRGVDPVSARREKLRELEHKMKELAPKVTQAHNASDAFSEQVLQDFTVFEQTKDQEIKQGLLAYTDCHIEFFQKSISIWEKILPELENMHTDSDTGDV